MSSNHLSFLCSFVLIAFVSSDISSDEDVNVLNKSRNRYETNNNDGVKLNNNEYVKKIFEKYGNGNGQMTFEGFEHLLANLGLESRINDHDLAAHYKSGVFRGAHSDHEIHEITDDTYQVNRTFDPNDVRNDSFKVSYDIKNKSVPSNISIATNINETFNDLNISKPKITVVIHKCLTASEILNHFKRETHNINENVFRELCPALVYELDERLCREIHVHREITESSMEPFNLWMCATGAVIAISLVGLLSILFIPLIQNDHQSDIIQLLVGLAIGTLTSDALLHLLPHAFSAQHSTTEDHDGDHDHDNHNHSDSVYFGLMALCGIIGFLAFERIVTIVSDLCNKSNKNTKVSNYNRAVGEKHSNRNLNSDQTSATELEKMNDPIKLNAEHNHKSLDSIEVDCLNGGTGAPHEMQMTTEQCHRETIVYPHPDPDRGYVVQLTDHHHHHSQTQRGTKSVIYMVVTGDGLHNFCDGIAIGVAFAGGGLGGGLSTTIAVLCHELPHEVGDFAVLLKAGLSVKRAIIYNALSGILCFVGMTIGVAIGKINDAWLSASIAGMFLYIALVDMIPQLDCCPNQSGTTRAIKLTIQLIGISIGVAIMCMISLYESHIKLLF